MSQSRRDSEEKTSTKKGSLGRRLRAAAKTAANTLSRSGSKTELYEVDASPEEVKQAKKTYKERIKQEETVARLKREVEKRSSLSRSSSSDTAPPAPTDASPSEPLAASVRPLPPSDLPPVLSSTAVTPSTVSVSSSDLKPTSHFAASIQEKAAEISAGGSDKNLNQLRSQIEALKQTLAAKEAELKSLTEQLDDLKNQSVRDKENTQHQIIELQRSLQESENARNAQKEKLTQLESALSEKSTVLQQRNTEITALKEEIRSLEQTPVISLKEEPEEVIETSQTGLELLSQKIADLEQHACAQEDDLMYDFAQALRQQYHLMALDFGKNKNAPLLCSRTITFINDFMDPNADRTNVLKSYEQDCIKTSTGKNFLKALAVIVMTAAGVIAGAAIGVGVGAVMGLLGGPGGGAAGALIGLLTGAKIGAEIAFAAAGAAVGGVTLGSAASFLMFKPDKLTQKTKEVTEMGYKLIPQA